MPLEIRAASTEWAEPLAAFFRALVDGGVEEAFHPHALTAEEATRRCAYAGRDIYVLLVDERKVLGYGMLRGWDQGYDVPSLGIAIRPDERGKGLAKLLMGFLHAAAARRGAKEIRLKVYPKNRTAVRLYESLGYEFRGQEAGQLVGFRDLSPHDAGAVNRSRSRE